VISKVTLPCVVPFTPATPPRRDSRRSAIRWTPNGSAPQPAAIRPAFPGFCVPLPPAFAGPSPFHRGYLCQKTFFELLVFSIRANVVVSGDTMNTHSHILFNKNLEQLRRLGARGGKARARNLRARRAPQMPPPSIPRPMALRKPRRKPWLFWTPNFPGYAAPKNEIPRRGARLLGGEMNGRKQTMSSVARFA
jgi:hypothetical protein